MVSLYRYQPPYRMSYFMHLSFYDEQCSLSVLSKSEEFFFLLSSWPYHANIPLNKCNQFNPFTHTFYRVSTTPSLHCRFTHSPFSPPLFSSISSLSVSPSLSVFHFLPLFLSMSHSLTQPPLPSFLPCVELRLPTQERLLMLRREE